MSADMSKAASPSTPDWAQLTRNFMYHPTTPTAEETLEEHVGALKALEIVLRNVFEPALNNATSERAELLAALRKAQEWRAARIACVNVPDMNSAEFKATFARLANAETALSNAIAALAKAEEP